MASGMDEDRLLAEIERSLVRDDPALDERMAVLGRQFAEGPPPERDPAGPEEGSHGTGRRGGRRDWRKVAAVVAVVVAVLGLVLTALLSGPSATMPDQAPPAGLPAAAVQDVPPVPQSP
ncbi:DUF3040 domain-containing protein [Streptomyces sp. CC228A]|uniref:DUF3040 domain-containing protein n=1 Tax=Streptomyces sp. CC228A TaxID=2898186 RepID=UPI001F423DFE|nr:DUF3040 domain-containing protein [Streptomyces sp. CC228A]